MAASRLVSNTHAATTPDSTPASSAMLEMRDITKRFPGVIANDKVSFDVHAGEVHTLLGENGAGKSTLMKILYGLYQPDEGQVRLHGVPLKLKSPADAIEHRIGMIHQHFMLVSSLTVTENVALGLASGRGPLTNLRQVAVRIRALSDRYRLHVDPDALIWQLSVGERQRVEIIKALYRDVQLLVLDEPTAVLTPQEVDDFFGILREMTSDGRGLIFISHKLNEVMELSDRITVLRNGLQVGSTTPAESSLESLAQMMVGREVGNSQAPRSVADAPHKALEINTLRVAGDRGVDALVDVDLTLYSGEILGVAGVSGNGQRELAESITGLRKITSGSIKVNASDDSQSAAVEISGFTPKQVRQTGIAFVPEERMRDGAIGDFSVADNIVLLNHTEPAFSTRGFLRFDAIRKHCRALVSDYQVKTPDIDTPTKNLSGGNIQKVIMARELASNPAVLIAAQPTRGVDIGAAEYIHQRLLEQRNKGKAIMVISEDLDEVLVLSDRIAVICEGVIMGIVDRKDATREKIGLMMAGVSDDAPQPQSA